MVEEFDMHCALRISGVCFTSEKPIFNVINFSGEG